MKSLLTWAAQGVLLLVAAVAVAAVSPGCAAVPGGERAARAMADAVAIYCLTPQPARVTLRLSVNRELLPGHSVKVSCPGDLPERAPPEPSEVF